MLCAHVHNICMWMKYKSMAKGRDASMTMLIMSIYFFFLIKRVLSKGKKKRKKKCLSPDPVKRTVGEIETWGGVVVL